MLFLEPWFWSFAAVAVVGYWLCPRVLRLVWLLGASLVFQWHFAGPAGMAPVLVAVALTYAAGHALHGPRGRRIFIGACALLVGALAFYKYSAFLVHSGAMLGLPPWLASWSGPAIPLGISFFTFEFVHYLYEVRVNGREPVRNPLHFSLFALFFPSLAAGPIKRYPDFVPQLEALPRFDPGQVSLGLRRILRGLFKKVCIADLLVEFVGALEGVPRHNAGTVGALAVVQGFRIYYDFAGYTDMAIGLAQLVGFRLPENFARPYFSTSLQDFWRRWHMSLSSWIRDYVYIPLGGNRRHRIPNLLLAMVLCGLWHGAAWQFAVWGLWHGTGLGLEAGMRRWLPTLFAPRLAPRLVGWAACYAFVTYGWLFFFYPVGRVAAMTAEALWSLVS
jgi:alginate O-acetyltransferase complex protein AlgI